MSLCWFCDRQIELPEPLKLPTDVNPKTARFCSIGQFCSWPCIKSYVRDYRVEKSKEFSLVRLAYAMSGHPADETIPLRPAKVLRASYGGPIPDAEWFRETNEPVLMLPPHLIESIETEPSGAPKKTQMPSSGFAMGPMKLPDPKPEPKRPAPTPALDVLSMLGS